MRYQLRVCMLLFAAMIGSAAWAAGEEGVPLALKFAPGDVCNYDISLSGSGGFRAPDGELAAVGLRGRFSIAQTVAQVLPDGSGRLEVSMPEADVSITIGEEQVRFTYAGGQVRWYANGQEHSPPQGEMVKLPLLETPLVVTIAPNGEVREVTVADPEMAAALQQSVPGVNLGRPPTLGQQYFPDQPVQVGETWRRAAQLLPLGPAFPMTLTSSRTLQSFSEEGGIGLAKIVGSDEVRYQGTPVSLPSGSDLNVAIPEMRQTISSTEFFNTTLGRLVRADYDFSFSTRVSVDTGEMESAGGVEARIHATVQAR